MAKGRDGKDRKPFNRDRRGEYIPRLAVADDLDADLVAHGSAESALDEVLIHPVVQVAHPVASGSAVAKTKMGRYRVPTRECGRPR